MKALTLGASLLALLLIPAIGHGQDATSRFQRLDRNGDGKISKLEYNSDAGFAALDTDHNNRVTAAELEAVLGPQVDGGYSTADRIRNLDRNQDGELNDEELRRGADTRFKWLDSNGDDEVDLAEFKSGFGTPAPRWD